MRIKPYTPHSLMSMDSVQGEFKLRFFFMDAVSNRVDSGVSYRVSQRNLGALFEGGDSRSGE